jgi:hypothetical protein
MDPDEPFGERDRDVHALPCPAAAWATVAIDDLSLPCGGGRDQAMARRQAGRFLVRGRGRAGRTGGGSEPATTRLRMVPMASTVISTTSPG